MEVIQQLETPKMLKRINSLECHCIKLNKKPVYFCDFCSEKKLLKKISKEIITDSSSFSDE